MPLEEFVDTFVFTRFEPSGVCDHPNIKMVQSVIDYVFRVLGMEYLGRTDFVQVKPADEDLEINIKGVLLFCLETLACMHGKFKSSVWV